MSLVQLTVLKSRFPGDRLTEQGHVNIRASAILTGSYVDTNYVDLAGVNQLAVYFKYTKASLTSLEYQHWFSIDGTTWYMLPAQQVALGTTSVAEQAYTYSGDDNFIDAVPVWGKFYKCSVKGTGTLTACALQVDVFGRY